METHHDEAGLTVAHDLRCFLCRIPEDDERFRVEGGWNGRDEFVETLLNLRPGDVLVTMGAGSISAVSHALPKKLGAAAARRQQ